jgi:hypothetical protein
VPAIQLPDGEQIERGDQQPDPRGKGDLIHKDILTCQQVGQGPAKDCNFGEIIEDAVAL